MTKRSVGLWCGVLGAVVASSGASCSDNQRPPPAGFGNAVTGGSSGSGGSTTLPRAGKSGKGGAASGASGDGSLAGLSGESPGGAGSGGSDNRGGESGKGGGGGAGNLGARGGGGNETAEGGALLTGPDLSCPKVTANSGSSAPVCNPLAAFGAGELVLAGQSGADFLLSITPDELTVAWRYAAEASGPTLYVADRLSVDEAFAVPEPLMDPQAAMATQIALSPGRLRLLAVVGGQLVEFVRSTTSEVFAYAGTGHFAQIDVDASERAGKLGDPVLAADDTTVYYTLESAELAGPTLYVAHRQSNDDFALGTPLDECNLDRASTGVRRPTGISADQRTLFYYDEPLATSRAAWRASPDSPFDTFIDHAGWVSVQPNGACDRLYYATVLSGALTIQVATEK